MQFLNRLKRSTNVSGEFLHYINKYQLIYKNLVKEAKKREREKIICSCYPPKIQLRECDKGKVHSITGHKGHKGGVEV
jgi:hypothetical protein